VNDTVRRFLFVAIACVATYLLLHMLRSLGVEPEARGIWSGATGYMLGSLALAATDRGRRRKR
jgi:hypothetical protein